MTQQNVEIVQRIFEGWARGDFRAADEALDENVVFVMPPEFPDSGAYFGRDALAEYTKRFLEPWERIVIDAKEIQAVGDTVLAHVFQHGKGVTSGAEVSTSYFMLFTLRGGKIVRLENVMEEADALAAVSLPE